MADDDRPASAEALAPGISPEAQALAAALADVLRPLARLAVAKGLPYAEVDTLIKRAFVQAAREAHPQLAPHRAVSRIATVTGMNRREVTRLSQAEAPVARRRPVAAEVFARWMSHPEFRDEADMPRDLPRQGPAPSFESLAQSVTRDVHPRSLLDELVRLGLAALDPATDRVSLVRQTFVPHGDLERLLGFLGQNVGDHLSAATANVLGAASSHFEQAVFADELSAESLQRLRAAISDQWRHLSESLVPQIEALIEEDRRAGRAQDHRIRIGLYSYSERTEGVPNPADDPPA